MLKKKSFPNKHQNFWHLASIQGMSFALPGLILPGMLAKQFGNGTALCSLFIGNLITWLVSIAIVAMSLKEKNNVIENAKKFFGKQVCFFISFILLGSFLIWYALQISSFSSLIGKLQGEPEKNSDLIIGIMAGIVIAAVAIGGIRIIRRTAIIIFPILLLFVLFVLIKYLPHIQFSGTWGVSFVAVALSVAIELTGTVNLPTFFRHSRSKADSMFALTIMNIYLNLYCLAGICLGSVEIGSLSDIFYTPIISVVAITFISILSLFGVNLVNIYFATAGWEALFPNISGRKKYFIIGVIGTIIFIMFHNYSIAKEESPLVVLANVANGYLSCLAISLVIAYFVSLIVQHRPRHFERSIDSAILVLGCVGFSIMYLRYHGEWSLSLTGGIAIILFFYATILFLEETGWAASQVIKNKE